MPQLLHATVGAAVAAAVATGCAIASTKEPLPLPSTPGTRSVVVKVIGFNDFHGNLESPGTFGVNTTVPLAQRPPVGGADFMAAWVARLKAANPNHVVVGAGDSIGATPLASALFHDEPAVEALNKIGLEFNAVGNHEFDKGKDELRRLQNGGCKRTATGQPDPNSCRGFGSAAPGSFDGARYQWLSANVIETAANKPLLAPYGVKTFDGVKVAFIGMTLQGTPGIVTPTGVAGLEFRDEAETVNKWVPQLRRQGIESIVVLVHQGGFQNGAGNAQDINGCLGDLKNANGSPSDIARIVARLDNAVDLVISGHTHAAYNCSASTVDVVAVGGAPVATPRPTGLPNKTGRLVPVTSSSAFGRVLTEVDLSIDPATRDVVSVRAHNRLVDRTDAAAVAYVAANPEVRALVDAYRNAVSPLANVVVGNIAAPVPNGGNAAGEVPAGDLVADAQLQATQPAGLGGASIAFMNPGGIRAAGFVAPAAAPVYPYALTYGDVFTVQPFGNTLVTMTLTAQQIKNLLEQQFVGCLGQTGQRILQVSNGFAYRWSAGAAPCSKVTEVRFTPTDVSAVPPLATGPTELIVSGGVVMQPTKTYRVTVNNFIATGGDGFTVLLDGRNQLGGAQDIDALVAYLAGYKAPAAPYDPASPVLGRPRIQTGP